MLEKRSLAFFVISHFPFVLLPTILDFPADRTDSHFKDQ